MPLEAGVAVGSYYSQHWSEVVVVDTDRMKDEMSCLAKMSLVGEEAAEVVGVGVDTVHTLADSYYRLGWDPPAREAVAAEERTDCRLLYRTAHNNHQRRVHKPGRSVAGEGVVHTDRKGQKGSGAEVDTDGNSVAGNDHIAGVEGAEGAEATKTDTAYGTAEAVVDVPGDVRDVPTGAGAPCSGEEAGAAADGWGDGWVEEGDAEVVEVAARMGGVEPVEVLDS
jgi:hypothetical protein